MWLQSVQRMQTLRTAARAGFVSPLVAVAWIPTLGLLVRPDLSTASRIVVAGMAVVALSQPRSALLILAGLVPLGNIVGLLVSAPCSLTEPLVMAFLSGWLSNEAFASKPPLSAGTRRLMVPVVLLATVVAASSVVGMAALQPFVAFPRQFLREVLSFFWSEYFFDQNRFGPLTAGLRFLEGLGLFTAVAILTERTKGLAHALARVTVAGAVGVAALSLNRLAEVVIRNGATWEAFTHYLFTIRITTAFPDLNAAGSYFAMTAVVAIGLAFGTSRLRWLWTAATCPLLAALWLTGSRVALFAVPTTGAAVLALAFRVRDGWRGRRVVVVASVALALLAVGALMPFAVMDRNRFDVRDSLMHRWDLTRAATAVAARHSVFGAGVGAFMAHSGEYFTPRLRRLFPRENAHNNFLQILAELGLAGFLPFLWLLAAVGARVWPGVTGKPINRPLVGAAGGISAFIVTWLTGHPLLILEVSCAFWVVLGTSVGLARTNQALAEGADRFPRRYLLPLTAAFAILVVVTTPARARDAVAELDLTHASIGLSSWGNDELGRPCRWLVASKAQFFVPAGASGMQLPVRYVAAAPAAAVEVVILLDGRLATRVRPPAGVWSSVAIALPAHASGPFHRVELDIEDSYRTPSNGLGDSAGVVHRIQISTPTLARKTAR